MLRAPHSSARRFVTRHRVGLGVAVVAVLAIVGGLLAGDFLSDPPGSDVAMPRVRAPLTLQQRTTAPTIRPVTERQPRRPRVGTPAQRRALAQLPPFQTHPPPYNPLNHLGNSAHTVVVQVDAAGPVGRIGYLVPTGLTSAQGTPTVRGSSWSLRQLALGPGKLAAVFLQTDSAGRRMSCTIRVDGRVTAHETVDRPYARTVCLG